MFHRHCHGCYHPRYTVGEWWVRFFITAWIIAMVILVTAFALAVAL